jgi:putative heme-binding domain-containing protein
VLQSAAVAALGSLDSSNVPAILLDDWRGHSPRLQQEILSELSSRRAWLGALLAALEAKQIRPGDLDAATRERLLTQGSDESRERAKVALAAVASASREKVLADYQSVIGMSGNPIRGAEMFGRRCTTCHLFRARGNKVGPDLAALQDKSARNIVTAVLDPNRAVEWGFRTYVAAMESGRVFNGMIIAESTNSVTLAEPDGRQHVLLRADLEELSETDRSFMPEGLEQDLNPQDLADVIAFLQSGPLAVGSVDRETAAAHAHNLQEAGALGIGEVTAADQRAAGMSWLGPVTIASCSAATSGSHRLAWRTPPQSADLDSALRHLLRVPIVLGIEGGGRPHLELQVGGAPVLDFELGFNDAAWSSADGRVVVRYLAMEIGREQGGGLLEIELPGDLLHPGEPVDLALGMKSASGQVGLLLPE